MAHRPCPHCGLRDVGDAATCAGCGQAWHPQRDNPYAVPRSEAAATVSDGFADPTNLALWATGVSALFCTCIPVGLIALVHADRAKKAAARDDLVTAQREALSARRWAYFTFGFAVFAAIVDVLLVIAQIAAES